MNVSQILEIEAIAMRLMDVVVLVSTLPGQKG